MAVSWDRADTWLTWDDKLSRNLLALQGVSQADSQLSFGSWSRQQLA